MKEDEINEEVDLDQEIIHIPRYLQIKDVGGLHPIHYAAQNGSTVVLHYLISQGDDVNSRDGENHTPLHWAAHNGSLEACTYLLNRSRCDINAVDSNGCTPLHWAVLKGHYEVVRILIRFHVNLKIPDFSGKTATQIAETYHQREIAAVLKKIERYGYDFIDPQIDRRPVKRYLIFITPFFLQAFIFYILCNYPVLSFTWFISLIGVIYFCYIFGSAWFPSLSGTSPYAYGHVVSAVLLHWAFYCLELRPCK